MKSFILAFTLLWPISAHADEPKLPLGYTCDDVRSAVAEYGKIKALALAIEKGATWRQLREARKCLK